MVDEIKKKSDLVVYKNEFNTTPLKDFNATEMNLLMAILSQLRDKGESSIAFEFDKLKELSKYNKETALASFIKDLRSTYKKLLKINFEREDEKKIVEFIFFTEYEINKEKQTVSIQINPKYAHLINKVSEKFTKFELEQFTDLKSSYSKGMYRLLKQFRTTGIYRVNLEDFKKLLDIPESYKISNIDQRVLKPITDELSVIFENLTVKKVKNKRKVVGLVFTFEPENDFDERGKKTVLKDGRYEEKDISSLIGQEAKKQGIDLQNYDPLNPANSN